MLDCCFLVFVIVFNLCILVTMRLDTLRALGTENDVITFHQLMDDDVLLWETFYFIKTFCMLTRGCRTRRVARALG